MNNSHAVSNAISTAAVALLLLLHIAASPAAHAQASQPAPEAFKLIETERRQGPFLVSGRDYFVVLRSICLSGGRGQRPQETLVGLKVLDAGGHTVREETFQYQVVDGRFARTLSASAALFAGMGGSALAIEFFEARPDKPLQQSWQLFGVVNARLEQFGMPLPVGQVGTVGGVVTAMMVQGGIAVVPMASRAEPLELPVWTGHFYAGVPVRMDWAQAKWGQGVQCFASGEGRLREDGCNMQVEAHVLPNADSSAVLLSPEPRQNSYTMRYVSVRSDSRVEILGTRAIVAWQENEGRIECHLKDLWLRVRVNNAEGWVSGSDAFAALGLAASAGAE